MLVSGAFMRRSQEASSLSIIQHNTVRHTAQGLKNLVSALAGLHNEAAAASSVHGVFIFDGSRLNIGAGAKSGPSKAAFTLLSH